MNSAIIFNHVRNKTGGSQAQYEALLRVLNSGADVNDVAIFVGLESENIGLQPKPIDTPKDQKWVLSQRSLDRLKGVDADLVKVVKRAIQISKYDFMVVEGLRTKETQAEYVKKGVSKTMNSYHLTGHAVDLAPIEGGAIDWNNTKKQFNSVADAMLQAAKELNVKLTWGGNWTKLVDMPHYQIEGKR